MDYDLKHLRDELTSDDPQRQISAARRCARVRPHELLGELLALGATGDSEARAAAFWAVDQMRAPEAVPHLLDALADPEFCVRSNAGWALVHLGSQVVARVTAVAKRSANPDAREMATLVLNNLPRADATLAR